MCRHSDIVVIDVMDNNRSNRHRPAHQRENSHRCHSDQCKFRKWCGLGKDDSWKTLSQKSCDTVPLMTTKPIILLLGYFLHASHLIWNFYHYPHTYLLLLYHKPEETAIGHHYNLLSSYACSRGFLVVSISFSFSLTRFWLTKVGSDCVWFEAQ